MKPPAWPLLKSGQADIFEPFPFGTDPRGRRVDVLAVREQRAGRRRTRAGQDRRGPGAGLLRGAGPALPTCGCTSWPARATWSRSRRSSTATAPAWTMRRSATPPASLRMLRGRAGAPLAGDEEAAQGSSAGREDHPRAWPLAGRMRLFPLVCIVDECQNLFTHPQHGDQAKDDAAYVIRLGRAYGIILVLATQRPDSQMLPTAISGNVDTPVLPEGPRPDRQRPDPRAPAPTATGSTRRCSGRRSTPVSAGSRPRATRRSCRTYYLDLPGSRADPERARVLAARPATLTGYALGRGRQPARRGRSPPTCCRCSATDGQAVVGRPSPPGCAEQMPAVYAGHHPGRRRQPAPRASASPSRTSASLARRRRQGCERAAIEAVTP